MKLQRRNARPIAIVNAKQLTPNLPPAPVASGGGTVAVGLVMFPVGYGRTTRVVDVKVEVVTLVPPVGVLVWMVTMLVPLAEAVVDKVVVPAGSVLVGKMVVTVVVVVSVEVEVDSVGKALLVESIVIVWVSVEVTEIVLVLWGSPPMVYVVLGVAPVQYGTPELVLQIGAAASQQRTSLSTDPGVQPVPTAF